MTILVLASTSAARRAILTAAGVPHEAVAPDVDETVAKAGMPHAPAEELAGRLAELKAVSVSQRMPGRLILGCDQVAATKEGGRLDKPASREEAAEQLRRLRGTSHALISAGVVACDGQPIWRAADRATLVMRDFSDAFLSGYLDQEWPAIGSCVGAYRLEAIGVQLFSRIEGDHFTILGLPMLPLLDFLRSKGVIRQ